MKKPLKLVYVLMLIFLSLIFGQCKTRLTHPQTIERTGAIKGIVQDPLGGWIVDATIVITNKRFKKQLKSDDAGKFHIELPVGKYNIIVEARGFSRYKSKTIKVKPRKTASIRIELQEWQSD